MAKTTAPLFGFEASGAIGKSIVFADWKGRSYARRYVVPANPQTAEQTLTRSVFDFLNQVWKYAPSAMTDAFNAYAGSQVMTGRNASIKFNLTTLRTAANLAGMLFSPGARSGLAASAIVLTPGAGQITVDITAPALPTGWTITAAFAAAIPDEDPNTSTDYVMVSGTDVSSPYQIVLAGLTAAQPYRVGAWFTYARPDGLTAYGPSIDDVDTPT